MRNPTVYSRGINRGVGASYAHRIIGNGVDVDVREVEPGRFRAQIRTNGRSLANRVFGPDFQAEVARVGQRHFQASARAGVGRRRPLTNDISLLNVKRPRPKAPQNLPQDWANCYALCQQTSNPSLCLDVVCDQFLRSARPKRRRSRSRRGVGAASGGRIIVKPRGAVGMGIGGCNKRRGRGRSVPVCHIPDQSCFAPSYMLPLGAPIHGGCGQQRPRPPRHTGYVTV